MNASRFLPVIAALVCLATASGIPKAGAAESGAASTCTAKNAALQSEVNKHGYRIQPGDSLEIYVRQDQSLQRDVLVLPDGTISLPLLGIVPVFDKTVQDVEVSICQNLQKRNLIEDPNVTVSVQKLGSNLFYVIGKVGHPGQFELIHNVDVIKALAMAGGLATFAKGGEIRILRRTADGTKEFKFDYGKFMDGHDPNANIMLQPGDTIIVP